MTDFVIKQEMKLRSQHTCQLFHDRLFIHYSVGQYICYIIDNLCPIYL